MMCGSAVIVIFVLGEGTLTPPGESARCWRPIRQDSGAPLAGGTL